MKFFILLCLIILSSNLYAQDDYYWYKGKKISLLKDNSKNYILYKSEQAKQIKTAVDNHNWKLFNEDEDRTAKLLKPLEERNVSISKKWAIIEKFGASQASLKSNQISSHILYSSPFFKTKDGESIGLSHLFYVKLRKPEDIEILKTMSQENNVDILGNNKFMPLWYTLACSKASSGNSLEMSNLFYESERFTAAEPDLMIENLLLCVNDTYLSDQWNFSNTGQYGGTNGLDIDICEAWELRTPCNDITIAILDHGIELNHPDLLNISPLSFDTHTGTGPSIVRGSHGTACAGIAGASSDNNAGIAGVAPGSQIMSISNSLVLNVNTRQQLADGINWAWQNGADVISNSWGHPNLAGALLDNAIDNALTQGRNNLGCIVVFATGNDNGNISYPANSNPDIIATGAMSPCGERKNLSSCDGETSWGSNYGSELDVIAPGVLIPTTDRQGNAGYNPTQPLHTTAGGNKITSDYSNQDYTVWFNGTSSATPHVAGLAALILSVNPSLTQDQVRDVIESTCTKVGNYNYANVQGRNNGTWDDEVGYGCINAFAALQSIFPTITGSDEICNSEVFSISNLPANANVTWSVSSGGGTILELTEDSPSINQVTIRNLGGSIMTNLIASINVGCGDPIVVTKDNIWSGKPAIYAYGQHLVNIYTGMPVYDFCFGVANDCKAAHPAGNADIDDWEWRVTGATIYPYGHMDQYATIYPNNYSTFGIEIRAHNQCGWSEWARMGATAVSCRSYNLSISPNPSSGETTLSIKSTDENDKNRVDLAEWDLEVFTQGQQLKIKKQKLKSNSFKINTQGWQEGVYIVKAKIKDEILTGKLVVRK